MERDYGIGTYLASVIAIGLTELYRCAIATTHPDSGKDMKVGKHILYLIFRLHGGIFCKTNLTRIIFD